IQLRMNCMNMPVLILAVEPCWSPVRFPRQYAFRRDFRTPMLPLRVTLISLLVAASTVLHVVPLLVVAVVKALLPFDRLRKASNPVLTGLAESWIGVNSWVMGRFLRTRFQVQQ